VTAIFRKLGVSSRAELAYKLSLAHPALQDAIPRGPLAQPGAKQPTRDVAT